MLGGRAGVLAPGLRLTGEDLDGVGWGEGSQMVWNNTFIQQTFVRRAYVTVSCKWALWGHGGGRKEDKLCPCLQLPKSPKYHTEP